MKINWLYNGPLTSESMDGHSVVNVNLIRELVLRGNVITFFYFSQEPCKETEKFVRKLGVTLTEWQRRSRGFGRLLSLLKYLVSRSDKGDEITVLGSNAMLDHCVVRRGTTVLLAGDVETRKWAQRKSVKTCLTFVCSLLRERIYSRLSIVVLYNRSDLAFLRRTDNVFVYPVCYNAIPPANIHREKVYDLIFTGNFNYHPNEEAASFILEHFADSHLRVALVGYGASRYRESGNNVTVKEGVTSLEEEILKSRIYLSPLAYGTGVKNKILSAVNCGLPIVCTPLSVEGIPVVANAPSVHVCADRLQFQSEIDLILANIDDETVASHELKVEMDTIMSWSGFAGRLETAIEGSCSAS